MNQEQVIGKEKFIAKEQVGLKPTLALGFFAFQGAFGVVAVFLFYYFKIPTSLAHLSASPHDWLKAVAASVPLLVVAGLFTSEWGMNLEPLKNIYSRLMHSPFGRFIAYGRPWMFVIVALLAGVGEEVGFRGLLQNKIGLLGASLIFGLFHFISTAFFLIATLIGCYLGWVFQQTDHNLFPPIFIHTIYDLAMLLLLKHQTQKIFETDFK